MRVAPLVGAWIEIRYKVDNLDDYDVAPLVGAWIEIMELPLGKYKVKVAPLVGAWIEIILSTITPEVPDRRSSCRSVD